MKKYNTYLSGEFQPNVFFDFGEGKLFSNKFAESLRSFPLMSGESDNGQYIFSYNNKSGKYEETNKIVPRCVVGIGGNESNNIKVNMDDVIILEDEGIMFNKGDTEPMVQTGYRPSVIAMPQYAPIVHDGVIYGEADPITPVDGELFTIIVEPNIDLMYEIENPQNTTYKYITKLIRRSSVLLCADRRRFKAEAYNSFGFSPEDGEQDAMKYKFKIGDEYCDFISLGVGSIIKMRCVVDENLVYWVVENHNVFKPLSVFLSMDVERYYDEGEQKMIDEYIRVEYEGTIYASRYICDIQSKIDDYIKFIDLVYYLSNDEIKDWRDRVIDSYTYDDY